MIHFEGDQHAKVSSKLDGKVEPLERPLDSAVFLDRTDEDCENMSGPEHGGVESDDENDDLDEDSSTAYESPEQDNSDNPSREYGSNEQSNEQAEQGTSQWWLFDTGLQTMIEHLGRGIL